MYLVLLFCLLSGLISASAQQKAIYTQYMFNGLTINPAYSAMDEAFTVTALSRHQWVGFKGAPNTQTLSAYSHIGESNTSVGGFLIRDQIGEVLNEKGAYLTLAQQVEIGDGTYLAVGFNGGISSYQANFSDDYPYSPESVNDPVFNNEHNTRGNFGFGVMLFSGSYYAGFSSPHFYYRDLNSFGGAAATKYRPYYMLQGGYLYTISDGLKLRPSVLFKYVNGSPLQFDLNANLLISERLWLGASYRSLDSFDAIAQLYITDNIALGYSFDFVTTKLVKAQRGTHEISLQFRFPVLGRDFPRCYF
ncbi:type IX secretion system membrane protein PorP/SprF [Pedobacter sp. BS3]|nr:type IX secretion system membrane protein PorP/SprF [Pedobacter sp. BS3]